MAECSDVQGQREMQGTEEKCRKKGKRNEDAKRKTGSALQFTSGARASWLAWRSLGPSNTTWEEKVKKDELKQPSMQSCMALRYCQGQRHQPRNWLPFYDQSNLMS